MTRKTCNNHVHPTMPAKSILLFDWDGVIADSNDFKWTKAWNEVFENESQKKAVANRLSTPEGRGLGRFELIKQVLEETSPTDSLESEINRYAKKFSQVTKAGVVRAGLFAGAKETLENLLEDGYCIYTISGTQEEDLKYIVEQLGIADLFCGIFGHPLDKFSQFKKITAQESTASGKNYTVIGDGLSDMKLAEQINCKFIGISNKWNGWSEDKNMKKISIPSLTHIKNRLLN